MLDKNLLAEHNLREHVRVQRERIETEIEQIIESQYGRSVSIKYDADDGGKWEIGHYHNKISTAASGAELALVVDAFLTALRANHGNKTLRALIAGPQHSTADQQF